MTGVALITVLLLAWANGANDNGKGVATLVGSGALSERRALQLALSSTALGAVASVLLGAGLLLAFSGKGLVPDSLVGDSSFLLSVGLGAGWTVVGFTWVRMPVSTTHALVGGLIGAGAAMAGPASIDAARLAAVFALPLLLSPLAAAVLTWLFASRVPTRTHSPVRAGGESVVAVQAVSSVARLHIASAATVSFARGLNDAPKIAALLAVTVLPGAGAIALVAFAMAAGGWFGVQRVTRTISRDITDMSEAEGTVANVVTAALVLIASPLGLPVSTTHVSVGAVFGIGVSSGRANTDTVRAILGAWVVTLPIAAFLAGACALVLGAGQ